MAVPYFTTKDNGPTIEEFIEKQKSLREKRWKTFIWLGLRDEVAIWWSSLDETKLYKLSDEEFEKVLLDKWSHARKQENETHKGLFLLVYPYCKFIDVFKRRR